MAKKMKGVKKVLVPGDFDLIPMECFNEKSMLYKMKKAIKYLRSITKTY